MSAQHKCPWPFCTVRVDDDLWGCKAHWFSLPPPLRKALWLAYVPGQSVATASDAYRSASAAIDSWIVLYMQTHGVEPTRRHGPSERKPPSQGDLPL